MNQVIYFDGGYSESMNTNDIELYCSFRYMIGYETEYLRGHVIKKAAPTMPIILGLIANR